MTKSSCNVVTDISFDILYCTDELMIFQISWFQFNSMNHVCTRVAIFVSCFLEIIRFPMQIKWFWESHDLLTAWLNTRPKSAADNGTISHLLYKCGRFPHAARIDFKRWCSLELECCTVGYSGQLIWHFLDLSWLGRAVVGNNAFLDLSWTSGISGLFKVESTELQYRAEVHSPEVPDDRSSRACRPEP